MGFNGTVKIVDFGIAKANTQLEQTRAGEIKGKLSYMSPEQAMGAQLDARSDIFALGSVVYEWVTGYKLFTGENEMAILKSIIDGKIYPPSYFKEDVPEAVERILMKALEKDKEKRYQSAWEMQFEIDTYLASSEFTPSNIHLSNFLKQIFGDEIEREKELLIKNRDQEISQRAPRPDPPSAHEHEEEILELEDVEHQVAHQARQHQRACAHCAAAARRTPRVRKNRSVSSAPSPKASASRPAPMRRWVSICHSRSCACATPRPNSASRTLAARMVGMPCASRSMRNSARRPGSANLPSVTGNTRCA